MNEPCDGYSMREIGILTLEKLEELGLSDTIRLMTPSSGHP